MAGGYDEDGNIVGKPWELQRAEFIDALCQRWHCPPDEVYRQDAQDIFRILSLLAHVQPVAAPETRQQNAMEQQLANLSQGLTRTINAESS